LPFFRTFGARTATEPRSAPLARSFLYTYAPWAEDPAPAQPPPLHLDHFWLWKPILGTHLQSNGLTEAEEHEAATTMHRPLLLEWLEFMLALEASGHAYVSQYSPAVKLVCATNVLSAVPTLLADPTVGRLLGRLVGLYFDQQLAWGARLPTMAKEKALRLKVHLERLVEAQASQGYVSVLSSQLIVLFLHSSFPEEFHSVVLDLISSSKVAFLQLGRAFASTGSQHSGLLANAKDVLPGLFAPPLTQLRRVDRLAELLVVLPNQLTGDDSIVAPKLHGNLLYWYLLHHVAHWLWKALPPGEGALPTVHRDTLLTLVQNARRCVVTDLLRYDWSGGEIHSVDQCRSLVSGWPKDRVPALWRCLPDMPALESFLPPVTEILPAHPTHP